ncbi:MAG: hypothetical protein AAFO94_16155, partial [Bacteroidota bacterium]
MLRKLILILSACLCCALHTKAQHGQSAFQQMERADSLGEFYFYQGQTDSSIYYYNQRIGSFHLLKSRLPVLRFGVKRAAQ